MKQRRDGRSAHQLRAVQISFDGLARVDGSARFGFGFAGPTALSSISGPVEVRLASEHAAQATFDVLLRPLSNVPATESKSFAATVRSVLAPSLILSHNPRTLVQLVAQALVPASGDALLAAVINASTLALLNAGSVPMKGVVCAVSVGRQQHGAVLIVDPDEQHEPPSSLSASGCFAFLFTSYLVSQSTDIHAHCVWSNWRATSSSPLASFDEQELASARELARRAAEDVYEAIKTSLISMGRTVPSVANGQRVPEMEEEESVSVKMEI